MGSVRIPKTWFSRAIARASRRCFKIPAQRVLTLANGWPRPFSGFAGEDPFAVRDFSETFRLLMEQEPNRADTLFPKTNRLKREYRHLLSEHVFGGFGLEVDRHGAQKRLVLKQHREGSSIPYMAWSAGQREFVPLLLGLFWLLPPASVKRRADIRWVVIEELEMGSILAPFRWFFFWFSSCSGVDTVSAYPRTRLTFWMWFGRCAQFATTTLIPVPCSTYSMCGRQTP